MGIFEQSVATFLAPVKHLLDDESVSEVLVNGPNEVFIERKGLLEKTDVRFIDEQALQAVVLFMQANPWAAPTGRYFGYRELIAALDAMARNGAPVGFSTVEGVIGSATSSRSSAMRSTSSQLPCC